MTDFDTDEVNVLGDQDAENLAPPERVYPPGSDYPTAQNVRRYPELFNDEVKAAFGYEEPSSSDSQPDVDSSPDDDSPTHVVV